MGESVSLEDIAKKTVYNWGKNSGLPEIEHELAEAGMQDPEGVLVDRIYEMVQKASLKVKIWP